jgi:hypothetical protein
LKGLTFYLIKKQKLNENEIISKITTLKYGKILNCYNCQKETTIDVMQENCY